MAIKKVATGWQVDLRPEGREGKRVRKTFPKLVQAKNWETDQKAKALTGEWAAPQKDKRRLTELVNTWHELHGYTLKDSENLLRVLTATCKRLGDPVATSLTSEDWLIYRKKRLKQKVHNRDKFVEPKTINHEQIYLSAVFNKLIRLKNWRHENPLKGVSKLPIDEPDLSYLEKDQIKVLLAALESSINPNVLTITKICLSTGARWGEAEKLHAEHVRHGKLHFVGTKNSKARAVPVSEELIKEILTGRPSSGRLFKETSYRAFENGIKRAKLVLPGGQKTHILRHTFASHYMINDGNILKLKYILGHGSLAMTIRYAKLAPNHLAEALTKNPLATL
ncbi:tyrosine-type recombinase/integrase [Hahella aquimaris]|uniref:phage integrase n=1 Tax=Hahella sp. HNIBRBA332 TaxID=3015983 RepID=UPI00273C97DF|nr:tyrosine-type recombinase/integrase [Hahella sp. HNIBRBA332]WLQ14423.1 tyrosine-type recombinase/integrase [Hahella sp. HNIBRBA332]